MRGLFITGTDTGVGKTVVAGAIVRSCQEAGLRVGAYKPVCSGSETDADGNMHWPDVTLLAEAVGAGVSVDRICPQRFHAPLAPPSAAACEGRTVDETLLMRGLDVWQDDADLLIVEGVGGLLCPLSATATVADFAAQAGYPLIIVAALRLGVINHTLMTIEVARQRGLEVAGVLLNEVAPRSSLDSCPVRVDPPSEVPLLDRPAVGVTLSTGTASAGQAVPVSQQPFSMPGRSSGTSDVYASSIAEIAARSPVPVLGILPFQSDPRLRPPDVIRRIDWWQLSAAAPVT